MPSQPRLDAPGTLHHVMGRGIETSKEDLYLLELTRYIHLNPLRAGRVPGAFTSAERPADGC